MPIDVKYQNPAPVGRTENGTADIDLYSDYSLKYLITVNGLATGDVLVAAHIHYGDAATNGQVILDFKPTFTGGTASGMITGIRKSLADTIQMGTVYFNAHSRTFPSGLVRGQMDKTIDYAVDVPLSGANSVPPVNTTATGLALLRLTTDKTLYSNVSVKNLEAGDTLLYAHIHSGAAGTNGPVIQNLAANASDFGIPKSFMLTDATVTALKTAAVYVNAHSKNHPASIIRGQIR